MNDIALTIGAHAFTYAQVALGFALAVILLLVLLARSTARAGRERSLEAAAAAERAREFDDKVAEMTRLQAEMQGRMQTMAEIFGTRQADLARLLSERLDGLQHRVGQGLETTARQTSENIARLNERLAVIDAAQKNLTDLTGEVVGLKDILANKQARGAYGQGRMEAIIRDGLPAGAYTFQATLSNRTRPDCLVHLPGDHPLVVDAKFPLEGFSAFREAKSEEARRQAGQRVKADVTTHVRDIAEKYLIPGETQDMALLFVPSEAIYADLHEHFDDVVQRAHRARVVVVSPSLLALAIQVMQALVRDARMREEAQKIQVEVRRLLDDVKRLSDRVEKLDTHFRQAQEDVGQIRISTDKIVKRGERIDALEFDDAEQPRPAIASSVRAAE
ncbi:MULTISPECIES: DNA recombination protein RmuC [unclassified Chelatococcus]|uniref:DNA recombination protein RmuC n=1 Tax=unclassified Chelatococcus TaxID=2638111 RepID=UPI0003065227|nr:MULTISPECIES: DNA recombination protein RmuC [unclassified Chelatococcus]ALA17032.1 DNA recombinase [Chelatococcus sp. CO-6]